MSPVLLVKGCARSAVSLNCTRKNSSSGLAVLRKWATASRDFVIFWPILTEAALNVPGAVGEGLRQVGRVVELYQEELVFGIGGLQKLGDSLAGLRELLAHAARTIEQNADGKGGVFARKLRDDLLLLVLKNLEILLFEAG